VLKLSPIRGQVAAISCGIHKGTAVLDLDYAEDSEAEADGNFVLTAGGGIVEVQATAERRPITQREIDELMALARGGCSALFDLQKEAVNG
jgi:ribonuclease PH